MAGATFESERTGEMALIQGAEALGFVIGPSLQAAFSPIGCSAFANSGLPYFSLDTYTSCGWCAAFLGLLSTAIFSWPNVFVEQNVAHFESPAANDQSNSGEGS